MISSFFHSFSEVQWEKNISMGKRIVQKPMAQHNYRGKP
jgi:hypothetical protein